MHTGVHTQSGVSCLPLLLSSLNQIPGTGLKNLNETPSSFEVLPLSVHRSCASSLKQVQHAHFVNTSCPFLPYYVWPLLHRWVSLAARAGETDGPLFALALTLGRGNLVSNPEIVYMCKSDKNPPPSPRLSVPCSSRSPRKLDNCSV